MFDDIVCKTEIEWKTNATQTKNMSNCIVQRKERKRNTSEKKWNEIGKWANKIKEKIGNSCVLVCKCIFMCVFKHEMRCFSWNTKERTNPVGFIYDWLNNIYLGIFHVTSLALVKLSKMLNLPRKSTIQQMKEKENQRVNSATLALMHIFSSVYLYAYAWVFSFSFRYWINKHLPRHSKQSYCCCWYCCGSQCNEFIFVSSIRGSIPYSQIFFFLSFLVRAFQLVESRWKNIHTSFEFIFMLFFKIMNWLKRKFER